MKKIVKVLTFLILLTGCGDIMNTPTKKVEELLGKYQMKDQVVLTQLDDAIEKQNLSSSQKDKYKDIMMKQYGSLSYKIMDETVNGDTAIVKTEIEVNDYGKVIRDANVYLTSHEDEFNNSNNQFDNNKFVDYKLKQMDSTKDRVKYTLELSVSKIDGKWVLDGLTDTEREKINGLYGY